MNRLQLVDTSMWTPMFRKNGDVAHKVVVQSLMRSGNAAWCEPVRLELWRGVGSDRDRLLLQRLEADILSLAVDSLTWDRACQLADIGRKNGLQFPSPDLMIFVCSKQHGVPLVHRDKHFGTLEVLWNRSGLE